MTDERFATPRQSVRPSDETTRRPAGTGRRSGGAADAVRVLTILAHPDLRRIGDRVPLVELDAGHGIELSRSKPELAPPDMVWHGRPLDDPYLSRQPWRLEADGEGLVLHRQGSGLDVRVDGEGVIRRDDPAGTITVPAVALDAGVSLILADRVALWLHRLPTDAVAGPIDREMVGASATLGEVLNSIERAADLGVPVLLRGESGTGKELAARALHARGRRPNGPFVAVNLGALSPTLAASELFGHTKGAFTGAIGKPGFFRAAEGGTLFLDEVGEAPTEVQAMLLRALEVGEIVPVGSHEPVPVDVRLIAATDSDLEARVRRGDFKEPLLHRLSAYEIRLPALRERLDDLGRLFVHFAFRVLDEIGEGSRRGAPDADAPPWLPPDLIARLARYPWPGNVRQLRNIVRQLVIDGRGEAQLRAGPRLEALLD
ncbi:MAG: sigma 54-interacting transcriptional regulator, partial [Acidobacteriota bacterium]